MITLSGLSDKAECAWSTRTERRATGLELLKKEEDRKQRAIDNIAISRPVHVPFLMRGILRVSLSITVMILQTLGCNQSACINLSFRYNCNVGSSLVVVRMQ